MNLTVQSLFNDFGFNVDNMEVNVPYNVENKNKKIFAYDHESGKNKYQLIKQIIYKGIHSIFEVRSINDDILVRGKSDHKIFDTLRNEYVKISESKMGEALRKDGSTIKYYVEETSTKEPIVDFEIEGGNYFSNDILSHNTVLHLYNDGETKDTQKVKAFIKNVLENTVLPYITYTPNLRICQKHGILGDYDNGNTVCPICKEESINSYLKKLEELKDQQAELLN